MPATLTPTLKNSSVKAERNRLRGYLRESPIPTNETTATVPTGWAFRAHQRATSKERFEQFTKSQLELQSAHRRLLDAVASVQFSPNTLAPTHGPQISIGGIPAGAFFALGLDGVGQQGTPISSVTTAGGTDATPAGANQFTVPQGANAAILWLGDRPLDEFYVAVFIKVGSASTRQYNVYRNRPIIVPAAAGDVIGVNTQVRGRSSFTLSDAAITLSVSGYTFPASLAAPSGVTGLANVDRSGIPIWAPTVANTHITLLDENSSFQINAVAGRRHIFMVEFDEFDNPTPVRHLTVNSSKTLVVQCRYRRIALATYAGTAISITAPTGSTIGGVSTTWRPSFTATSSTTVSTVAEFKAAINGTAHNDIIVASGTYTLSGSDAMISSNYAAGMGRTLRIRSATGNPADVTFTASDGWNVVVAIGQRWVVEGFTININGNANIGAHFTGRVDGASISVTGTPSGNTVPSLAIIGTAALGAITNTFAWGTISGANEDTIDLSQDNGQTAGHTVGQIVGYTLNGNGPSGNNAQIATAHFASVAALYGCRLTDTGLTANQVTVAPDSSSFVYLHYCSSPSADIANALGISITSQGVFFCDFGAVQRFVVGSSAIACYLFGTAATQKLSTGLAMVYGDLVSSVPLVAANDFTCINVNSAHGIDCRTSFEITGNRFSIGHTTTSTIGLRVNTGTPNSGSLVRSRNNHYTGTGYRPIELGTSANISLSLINDIYDLGSGTLSFGATGTTDNIAENCFFPVATYPTNFTTRFTATGTITSNVDGAGNYWSGGTAPGLDADGVPTTPGLSDTEGKDISIYAGLGRDGRALRLGGSFVRGPIEQQAIKVGAVAYPASW